MTKILKNKLMVLFLALFAIAAVFAAACSSESNNQNDENQSEQTEQQPTVETQTYSIIYSVYDSVGGTIQGESTQTIDEGKDATAVTAVADEGYRFDGWSDGVTTAERTDLNISSDTTVYAKFVRVYNVTFTCEGGGTIVGETTQSVDEGNDATAVTAVAENGYRFDGWSDGVTTAERIDLDVSSDMTVYAVFVRVYTVTFVCEGGGSIDGETTQTVDAGEACLAVTAVADVGYKFDGWSTGDSDAAIKYTPPQDSVTISAVFSIEELDLPIMLIETKNGESITSKEEYLKCNVTVMNADEYEFETTEYKDKIRGRGNTSWSMPQKSYKLKFDKKTDLFGNGAAKTWTLIANYIDKSLIRNYLAYSVGSVLGSNSEDSYGLNETTTTTQFIELYVNGEYLGVYLVCEQNETGSTRINIEDEYINKDKTFVDPSKIGYLLELDGHIYDGLTYPNSNSSDIEGLDYFILDNQTILHSIAAYCISSPDYEDLEDLGYDLEDTETLKEVFEPYVTYIKNWMTKAYGYLSAEDTEWETITQYFDVNSFAQAYVLNELFKTVDCGWSSFYVFKTPDTETEGGKLYCGPIWDYDLSSGNCKSSNSEYVNSISTDSLYAATANSYYYYLLKHDEFKQLVKDILTEYDSAIRETISTAIDYVYANSSSFLRHFEKWSEQLSATTNTAYHPDAILSINTWEGQVEYLRVWLLASLSYMEYYYLT